MQFEIAGKGAVCTAYYIEKQKLDEISPLIRETGPGLKDLLLEHSDDIIKISRGFLRIILKLNLDAFYQMAKLYIKVILPRK